MPSEVRFAVVRKLLESAGWTLHRIKGSHHVFTKAGMTSFPVPVHRGKVAHLYFRKAQKLCDSHEDDENENES